MQVGYSDLSHALYGECVQLLCRFSEKMTCTKRIRTNLELFFYPSETFRESRRALSVGPVHVGHVQLCQIDSRSTLARL